MINSARDKNFPVNILNQKRRQMSTLGAGFKMNIEAWGRKTSQFKTSSLKNDFSPKTESWSGHNSPMSWHDVETESPLISGHTTPSYQRSEKGLSRSPNLSYRGNTYKKVKSSRAFFFFGNHIDKKRKEVRNPRQTDSQLNQSVFEAFEATLGSNSDFIKDQSTNSYTKMGNKLPSEKDRRTIKSGNSISPRSGCSSGSDVSSIDLCVQGRSATLQSRVKVPKVSAKIVLRKAPAAKTGKKLKTRSQSKDMPQTSMVEEKRKEPPKLTVEIPPEPESSGKKTQQKTAAICARRGQQIEIRLPSPCANVDEEEEQTDENRTPENSFVPDTHSLPEFKHEKRTYVVNQRSPFLTSQQRSFTVVFPDEVDKLEPKKPVKSNPLSPGWLSPVPFSRIDLSLAYVTPEHSPLTSPMPHMDHVSRMRARFFQK
eukprot:Seg1705.7 transcript_id=Seg1705.7/GoldUCD/mRNA.D3Y31 product="hypothetical protein" protein_id=Seg1705.7/GoldUCD/D3Y31